MFNTSSCKKRDYICVDCGDFFKSISLRAKRCGKCRLIRRDCTYLNSVLGDKEDEIRERLNRTVKIYNKEEIEKLEKEILKNGANEWIERYRRLL